MGVNAPERSESDDQGSASLHLRKVLASNTGVCVEDSLAGIGLNLGSGRVHWPFPWKNVDLEQGDIRSDIRKIDLPDGYAQAIAAIHVIEHFYVWEVPALLVEWKRLLKPGGKLILELPSMDKVINYLHACVVAGQKLSPTMSWFVFWGDPRAQNELMIHRWGYTEAMLREIVEGAGFIGVTFETPRYHF